MKLGIVGTDNTHALGFSRLVNIDQRLGADVRVVAIFGSDREQAESIARTAAINQVAASPEAMVPEVDAAIIVDRDGGLHRGHAAPFLAAGMPVLVDKPLATSVADAEAILKMARKTGSPLTSYSSLRWCTGTRKLQAELRSFGSKRLAVVSGPCDIHSQYGGHFFYGIHIVEISLALFPGTIGRLRAVQGSHVVTVVMESEDGPMITLHLLDPSGTGDAWSYPFHASVFGTTGFAAAPIENEADLYQALNRFLGMIETGKPVLSDEEMLEPIRVLEAVSGSLADSGGEVAVHGIDGR